MLEKLKMLESYNIDEILELKTAIIAYDLGLTSTEITFEQIDRVEEAMNFYWNCDELPFVDERILDVAYFGEEN